MKKIYLILLMLVTILLLTGCDENSKTLKYTRKEPFDDKYVNLNTDLELDFDGNNEFKEARVILSFAISSDISDQRKEEFKESIYKECSDEPGINFDYCDIVEENNKYYVKLTTKELALLDSAISTDNANDFNEDLSINDIKNILSSKGFKRIED